MFVGDKMINSIKYRHDGQTAIIGTYENEGGSHPSYLIEKQLLYAIKQGDPLLAEQLVPAISQHEHVNLASEPLRSKQNQLICSCTLFTKGIIDGGVHPTKAYPLRDSYIRKIEKTEELEELEQYERMMLHYFIDFLNQETDAPYSKVINDSIAYIHDNLLQDLTLDMIAEHCFVSPSYLSHLFKKEVGISVVQFINQKRIEESKSFLLQTSIPISDISTLFQFCNQSYYTSLFKKYTGKTPKEYRGT